MNLRIVRILLWCVAAVCGSAAILVAVGAAILPVDLPSQPARITSGPAPGAQHPEGGENDLSAVMDIELRRPLTDVAVPRPVPEIQVASEPPVPAFHLSGTIVEPGHSLALFTDSAGKTQFKRVGEQAQGATVLSIRQGGATLQWNGRQIVVPVDRPGVANSPPVLVETDRR